MDPYGVHFQVQKREANALDKLKKQWAKAEAVKCFRESKLVSFEEMQPCCRKQCCSGNIETAFLREIRRKFLDCSSQVDRKRFLLSMRDPESPSGFSIVAGGKPLCYRAMRSILGVSVCLLASVTGTPRSRAPPIATRRPRLGFTGRQELLSKGDRVENWLHCLIDQFCDIQPDKGELHLPFGQQKDVYERYMDQCRAGDERCPCVSKMTFYRVWKQRCSFIKVRAFHRFAICPTCVEIQEEWHRAKTPGAKSLWRQAKEQHYNDVRVERAAYHYRCQRCVDFKDGLSLVVDGAEFSLNSLPHFSVLDKFSQEGWKIKTKLYGAIIHGEFSGAFLYPDYMEGGSNCVIEVIHRMLTAYVRGDPANGRPPKRLPPTLYLQLDNTVKECKNRFIFAYLKSLVDCGVFQHVNLSFLQVGHTHCDIDQMFSRISVFMQAHSAYNFKELGNCLRKAFSDIRVVEVLEKFTNFRDAVKSMLNRAATTPGLDHFDDFRFFHFFLAPVMDGEGNVHPDVGVFQCKARVSDNVWHDTRGNKSSYIPLFKDPTKVLTYGSFWNVRDSIPPFVVPEQPMSTITQLQHSLDYCTARIRRTREPQEAEEIINDLQVLINKCSVPRSYPFKWNLQVYRSPPRMTADEYRVSDELLAQLQETCMDRAMKRLEMETCTRVFKRIAALEPSHFVVVHAPADVPEPFYVAEVIDNDIVDELLTVRWYAPTNGSKSRTKNHHQMNYELELVAVGQSRGRQNGQARFRMDQRTDIIEYNQCFFGFSKLKGTGGLSPEVQRQLRSLGLISGKIARR